MTRARAIREYLASQSGPRTSAQIQAAVGISPRIATGDITSLVKAGALVKHGHRPASYSLGVPVVEQVRYATEEERAAAKRANGLRWYAKKSAELGHAPRKPRKDRPSRAKPAKFKPIAVPRMRLVASQPEKPAPVPLMSSAEWLAANPTHRIEVIAPGVFSERNQFKHIGVAA